VDESNNDCVDEANANDILLDKILDAMGIIENKKRLYGPNYTGYEYTSQKELQFVWVDLPEYTGPRCSEDLPPTYVLFGKHEVTSRCGRSTRIGFPFHVAKCDSVHSSQGITTGPGKQFEYIVACNWKLRYENMMPGLWYVFASRVMTLLNLYLDFRIDKKSLDGIGGSKIFKLLHEETRNNTIHALNRRESDIRNCIGTKDNFVALVSKFVECINNKWSPENSCDDAEIRLKILRNIHLWQNAINSSGLH
jgi:hypothetical protein